MPKRPKLLFEKLPRSEFRPQDRPRRIFETMYEHINRQVEDIRSGDPDPSRLERIPVEGQVVYWLWRFVCEAGSNGLEVFTLEPLGIYAPQIHGALKVVGAGELVRRLEAAIYHARHSCAEFRQLKDISWFEQFPNDPKFPTLQSVDKGIYSIIDELTGLVVTFINANERILVEKAG